jgi:hypothetical protein
LRAAAPEGLSALQNALADAEARIAADHAAADSDDAPPIRAVHFSNFIIQ